MGRSAIVKYDTAAEPVGFEPTEAEPPTSNVYKTHLLDHSSTILRPFKNSLMLSAKVSGRFKIWKIDFALLSSNKLVLHYEVMNSMIEEQSRQFSSKPKIFYIVSLFCGNFLDI